MKFKMIFTVLGVFLLAGCSLQTTSSLFTNNTQREQILKLSMNYEKLIAEYRDKLSHNKNDIGARVKLAQLYFDTNDLNNANYYIEPLVKQGKNIDALILKAKILEKQRLYQQALDMLDEALNISSKNAEIWNLKAIIFARNGYYKEAKNSFESAKQLFYDDYKINTNLGILEILQGNYKLALTYLKPLYIRGYKNPKFLSSLVYALIKNQEITLAKKIVAEEGLAKDFKSIYANVIRSKTAIL